MLQALVRCWSGAGQVLFGMLKVVWWLVAVLVLRCRQGFVVGAGQSAVRNKGYFFDVLKVRWPLVVHIWILVRVRVLLSVLRVVWWLLSVLVW